MGIMLGIILDYMAIHHQHLSTMIWGYSHITVSAPWPLGTRGFELQIVGMERKQNPKQSEKEQRLNKVTCVHKHDIA